MLRTEDIYEIAEARLEDAKILLTAGRYDGAVYLCGYATEVALKGKICRTLGWEGYPSTRGEFQSYQSFRTHDLDVLLRLSGVEMEVRMNHLTEWSVVANWDPEVRYRPIGTATEQGAKLMIESTETLMRVLA